jgi:hypothetical protein
MEWISVKDRLPEKDIPVLIYHSPYIGIDMITHPKDGNLWACTYKECITHWLSLPNPPKE